MQEFCCISHEENEILYTSSFVLKFSESSWKITLLKQMQFWIAAGLSNQAIWQCCLLDWLFQNESRWMAKGSLYSHEPFASSSPLIWNQGNFSNDELWGSLTKVERRLMPFGTFLRNVRYSKVTSEENDRCKHPYGITIPCKELNCQRYTSIKVRFHLGMILLLIKLG